LGCTEPRLLPLLPLSSSFRSPDVCCACADDDDEEEEEEEEEFFLSGP